MRKALLAFAVLVSLPGCKRNHCALGDQSCELPPPCESLRLSCQAGFARVSLIDATTTIPAGPDALASLGDVLLENDQIRAVIDALDHPHHLAETGGALIDLELRSAMSTTSGLDGVNVALQATGLLPKDAVTYLTSRRISGEGFAAVELRGTLLDQPDILVATRYEIRPCDTGIRVRTEISNLDRDDGIWSVTDGWFWGARSLEPFLPIAGRGFSHPSFGLTDIDSVFVDAPFVAATSETSSVASYAIVACDRPAVSGFHSDKVSAIGTPRLIVAPGDHVTFERYIMAAEASQSVAPAVDRALEVRKLLFDEPIRRIRGRTNLAGQPNLSSGTLLVSQGTKSTPAQERIPRTHILPKADGSFEALVPANQPLVIEGQSYSHSVFEVEAASGSDDVDLGELVFPSSARLLIELEVDEEPSDGLAILLPRDEETTRAGGKLLGSIGPRCSPILGPPNGGSPACNRVLLFGGHASVSVPPGRYRVYGSAGLFASLDYVDVELVGGETKNVMLAVSSLTLTERPVLSSDFHVHGAASFDSSIPDLDRVASFLAARLDVVVATDHDVVTDYGRAISLLDAGARLRLVSGVETTGLVLFDLVKDQAIPKVIGHYNFWPVQREPFGAWRGSVFDEKKEPGSLFDDFRTHKLGDAGVIQLNHPYAEAEFGRDLGFPKALELDTRSPLSSAGTGKRQIRWLPTGSRFDNLAYDTQEIMNGTDNSSFPAYRSYWFYLLNEGIVRAGTANSDSHGLTDNIVGTPRTLVFTDVSKEQFDLFRFDEDVKRGSMMGTNGPVIEAAVVDADGAMHFSSTSELAYRPGSKLKLRVAAAPWVPIEEVRIIVNGSVARVLGAELSNPADVRGTQGLVRFSGELEIDALLPSEGDAWIVVEAGAPIPISGDLDCDGVPDTADNDANGVVDWRDADDNESEPESCEGDTGPLAQSPSPSGLDDPLFHFQAITPKSYPLAFTNPFIFDRNGDGFRGASR